MSRIAVIGTGYVGLTTGAYLAHIGHEVVCADVIEEKIARLSRGEVPIFETGLEDLVRSGLESGLLRFVVGSEDAVAGAEFVFLCLPTPQGEDGSADLSYVRDAADHLGPLLDPGSVVINKSTVPVGSTRMVERSLARGDVFVVSNPEFLREGSAVHDCLNPDRIVIGADDAAAASRVAALYERIRAPVLVTDPASAELIKYASNAFLATKISYINAIANLCEVVGADVKEVVLGMGYDKRIGFEFLRPGPGWGGSCFHPDETVLVRWGDEVRLLSFAELFAEVERLGPDGWEALAWEPSGVGVEFRRISGFVARPFDGPLLEVRTKMGRRIRTTPDHPYITGAFGDVFRTTVKPAAQVNVDDWLPLALDFPDLGWEEGIGTPLGTLDIAGLTPSQVIVRCRGDLRRWLVDHRDALPPSRRRDILRCSALRLGELQAVGLDLTDPHVTTTDAFAGTTTNGTFVPGALDFDEDLWWVIGVYLAEGCITRDGQRRRLCWFLHPRNELELVERLHSYWTDRGVKVSVTHVSTSQKVAISSRILAGWFEALGLGVDCYTKRVPNVIWGRPDGEKQALLRGLWDGDGSWSLVNGGPSVVFEYGTASSRLADGMVRLLGSLGITARAKVGRTKKSTVDTYWLTISGADQLERALWLFPRSEQQEITAHLGRQAKRIAPTGFRSRKNAAWVRVVDVKSKPYSGFVYSIEVPGPHTIVTSGGLILHNCFPKDTRALVRIAEDAGYDFGLLNGVIGVNTEQYIRMTDKIQQAAEGGSLEGRTVAVWGLTFKAMTDDLRDSPALEVVSRLQQRGAEVRAFDPMVDRRQAESDPRLAGLTICADPYDACTDADLVALLTEWDEFRWLDFEKVKGLLRRPVVVDCRNLMDPAAMRKRGFVYHGVGRA